MSIFNKIDPGRIADDVLNRIVRPAADGIRKGLEGLGRQIEGNVRNVANQAENGLKNVGHTLEAEIKKVATDAESHLKGVGADLESGFKTVANETEKAFTKQFPELLEYALQETLKQIAKGGLSKAVDIIQVLAPSRFSFTLGPVTLNCEDITDKVDTLQEWAKNPPSTKADIKVMIETLAPTSVEVDLSVGLAALFVQSDSLEIGASLEWETSDFLGKLDEILNCF